MTQIQYCWFRSTDWMLPVQINSESVQMIQINPGSYLMTLIQTDLDRTLQIHIQTRCRLNLANSDGKRTKNKPEKWDLGPTTWDWKWNPHCLLQDYCNFQYNCIWYSVTINLSQRQTCQLTHSSDRSLGSVMCWTACGRISIASWVRVTWVTTGADTNHYITN